MCSTGVEAARGVVWREEDGCHGIICLTDAKVDDLIVRFLQSFSCGSVMFTVSKLRLRGSGFILS